MNGFALSQMGSQLTREQRKAQKKKIKRHQKAIDAGTPIRSYQPTGLVIESKAEWQREYKRMQRIKQAERERRVFHSKKPPVLHDAQVKALKTELSNPRFDAHVKAFEVYMKAVQAREANRIKAYQSYQENPDWWKAKRRNSQQTLVRSYVVEQLMAMGIPKTEISDEMINLKREQIQLRRLSRELKHAAANSMKEPK